MGRLYLPVALISALALIGPGSIFAQSDELKAPNKNLSARFKSAIFRGAGNRIESNSVTAFIGGGMQNTARSNWTIIAGGYSNSVSGNWAAVGGGALNAASGDKSVISGGGANKATRDNATVSGGFSNGATGFDSTVGGGYENVAGGEYGATVSGGHKNVANGEYGSTVSGGYENIASGSHAAVGGGRSNSATGQYATIPGGIGCLATNEGSFVWSGVGAVPTSSTNTNSFTVRAPGGVRFITTIATNNLDKSAAPYFGSPGLEDCTNGVVLLPGANSWAALSDSNTKTAIRPIDSRAILRKLAELPVTEWQYKGQPERNYIGPMAQDFHAAFGLGYDDKTIATADTDGVMYAAIQGLVEELKERDEAIDELKTELRALREQVEGRLPPSP